MSRVVFVTGGAFKPAGSAFLASVQNACILKPFDAETIRSLVETPTEVGR